MFTKGKPEGSTPSTTTSKPTQGEPLRQAATKPATRSAPSLISVDIQLKGSIVSEGEIQIDGKVEGDVKASALTVGDSGEIIGEVVAETIVVRGTVKGHIRARKVQLASSAKVQGDITHSSLSIEANAIFEGQVKHSEDPLKAAPAPSMSSATTSV
ncbi:polymer-forming cytoskeletal protein [Ponticaulis sp.]|uniref:bactofilin family protein n=1 Tax=Ponticaulis sp. TaxID=2020902 RepID=UPI000B76694F|nr:polymer-forming cytoskeletal protein [Ponticaulis sp.]MAI89547.1 hypothetical protein [Ponticaulis sp.]OUY00578.1 MAG: hypothetical protein CBB65_03835 [Hyphomonadaceae bacterium TMED5]|tara:strand:- start:71658 stop:72125 length:468 start_codon:yes stop_codon:yes gene_type:complete